MKKYIYTLASAWLLLSACDDFHTSDNGNLDGYWQLTNVDSLHNGQTADVRDKEIFWAVQTDLLEMRNIEKVHPDIFFRFSLEGNKLTLTNPVADDRPISDSLITDEHTLHFYGLSHLTETLRVLQLSAKKMTLESERLRMYFRKY